MKPAEPIEADRVVADVPCPFCGCLCDDLRVTVVGERIVAAAGACPLGEQRFLADDAVEIKPAEFQVAIAQAAELLCAARYPLVYGLSGATCEAQTVAVGIA